MESLQRICLFLNADGFHLRGKFFAREIAYVVPHPDVAPRSVHFKVISPRTRLEHQHVEYVFNNVHGLCLKGGGMDQQQLTDYLTLLYQLYQSPEQPYVAIKGNNQLHKLLKELKIPVIDLEKLGCPSFDEASPFTHYTCHQHRLQKRCARAMVAYYRQWILDNLLVYQPWRDAFHDLFQTSRGLALGQD